MKNVAAVLRTSGIVALDEVDSVLDLFGDTDEAWQNLVSQGLITENDYFQAVAEFYNLEFVDISTLALPPEIVALVPGNLCRANNIIPIGARGDHLFLAVTNPEDLQVFDEIGSMSGYIVAPKVVTQTALKTALDRYIRADEELDKLAEEVGATGVGLEDAEDISDEDDDAPIVRFVNLLISQAVQDRASDIHVEPSANDLRVRFRIDGVLHEMQRAAKNIQAGIISRLKIMADMDIAEKRKPQDGRMSINYNGQKIDIRVAALPTVWGEKIIMRILDHSTEKRELTSMGMSDENLRTLREALSGSHGMILVTGPTGSGKSTTLYTSLDEVSTTSVNVITVEDPVEKRIEGVNQVQINNKAGMTFPAALKSILRADPDVVMIGEIRDQETAIIAVEASMTGHLVLSTLHTNGAPESLSRLVEMGVEPYLVGNSVSAIAAQRLARKLCDDCKTLKPIDRSVLEHVGFPMEQAPEALYAAKGCTQCSDTGYRGRVAVVEVMKITENIEKLVVNGEPASKIRAEAEKDGFKSLRADGFRRVLLGETTVEEVMRVSA